MTEYYLEATDLDERCWMRLPTEWPLPDFEDVFPDPVPWARAAAGVRWEDSGLTPRHGEVDELARVLVRCAALLPGFRPGFEIFLHLPSPRDTPLAVYVGDYESAEDNEPHVRFALGLDEPDAVEPPLIEDFAVPTLGTGKRALRYAKDDEGGIVASLRYAWDVERYGLFASVIAVADPIRVIAAVDDLDRLCRGLRYLPEDAFPE
jgi:hypothetical protein